MSSGLYPSMASEASNGAVADIGALLRASRIRRGEGLRDIADQLRIRFVHLEAIENGRFDNLPGNTYAIGFIRTYAEHLGLDGEEIVRRFKSLERESSREADLVFPSIIPEHGVPGGAIVMVGVLVAVVGYGSWYFLSSRDVAVSDTVPPVPSGIFEPVNSETVEFRPARKNALVDASSALAAPAPLKQPAPRLEKDTSAPAANVLPALTTAPYSGQPLASIETTSDEAGTEAENNVGSTPPVKASTAIAKRTGALQVGSVAEVADAMPSNQRPGTEGGTGTVDQPVVQEETATPAIEVASQAEKYMTETTPRIVLTAKEASWIQIRVLSTNKLILSKVLLKDHSYEVPNRTDLGLMTGNAGALAVSVDGDTVPSVGKLGQTRQKIILNADRLRDGTAVEQ
ncbi:MAG: helix-turn-helix domain-containing protein [Rhodospirillales bacterium]|nr:helix-turn-helix domain-containing protein [Rhodospirillales bacterium]